jgi:hypothetical protein
MLLFRTPWVVRGGCPRLSAPAASSIKHSRRPSKPIAPYTSKVLTDAYEAPPLYQTLHENVESFYKVQ